MAMDPQTLVRSLRNLGKAGTAIGVGSDFMTGFSPETIGAAMDKVPRPIWDALSASYYLTNPVQAYIGQEAFNPRMTSELADMTPEEVASRGVQQKKARNLKQDEDEVIRQITGRVLPANSPRRLQILHSIMGGGSINNLMTKDPYTGDNRFAPGEPSLGQNPLRRGYGPEIEARVRKMGF